MRYVVLFVALCGCSDWTQVKNAHDAEGQLVKVESKGKEPIMVDELVVCDDKGFLFAAEARECQDTPFDVRKDKTLMHDKDTKASVGLIVTGILTAVFTPIAIVGSAILSQGK